MTVGATEITQARAGVRIVLVTETWDTAREELERIAELAGDDAKVNRTAHQYAIEYEQGSIRIISAGAEDAERGHDFDTVIIHPGVVDQDLVERYAVTLDATGGTLAINGEPNDTFGITGTVVVCTACGAQLADSNPGATIRHDADGGHTYQQ